MAAGLVSVDPVVGRWFAVLSATSRGGVVCNIVCPWRRVVWLTVCLSPVPRSPGRAVSYSGSLWSEGRCSPITSGAPLPGPCLSPLLISPLGSGCASLQEHRLFSQSDFKKLRINVTRLQLYHYPPLKPYVFVNVYIYVICTCLYIHIYVTFAFVKYIQGLS